MKKRFQTFKNIQSFPEVIKSLSYAVAFYLIINSFNFYPQSITVYMSIAVLLFALAMPNLAIGLFILSLVIPLYALRLELLLLFAVPAIALGRLFNEKRGLFFVLLMLSVLGSFKSIELAPLLLAVYFLGLGSAFLTAVSVLTIETVGILLGKPLQGLLISAGTQPLLSQKTVITFENIADFGAHWSHIQNFDISFFAKLGEVFANNSALFMQPLIWTGIAVIAAKFIKKTYKQVAITYIAIITVVVISELMLGSMFGGGLYFTKAAVSGIWSFLVAMALTYPSLPLGEGIFEDRAPESVLVIDIVGSTRLGEKFGDQFAMKIKNRLDEIVKKIIVKHDYRFIKGTGDGYFVTFPDSNKAAKAALEILKINNEKNTKLPEEEQIGLKMGMAFGELIIKKDDRHGNTVNIAFRIQGVNKLNLVDNAGAEAEMPISNCLFGSESAVEDITNDKFDVKFIGYFEAKGLYGRHRLYEIKEKVAKKDTGEEPHFKVIEQTETKASNEHDAIEESKEEPTITT